MHRMSIVAVLAAAAWAQAPGDLFNKPPAEVDQALRARITQFYDYHVKKEFRKAEDLVASDTKEFFYSHNKPQYLSFEIKDIKYSDNFTKARAMIVCEQYVMFLGFADKPIKIPTPSTWKLEDGQWVWYVDQDELRNSPFGKMTGGTAPATGAMPSAIPSTIDFVLNKVQVDRRSIAIKPGESSEVHIANTAPGVMTISTAGSAPGITAQLSKTSLNSGESAVLKVKAAENARSGTIQIQVQPTGEIIPVQIEVK